LNTINSAPGTIDFGFNAINFGLEMINSGVKMTIVKLSPTKCVLLTTVFGTEIIIDAIVAVFSKPT